MFAALETIPLSYIFLLDSVRSIQSWIQLDTKILKTNPRTPVRKITQANLNADNIH